MTAHAAAHRGFAGSHGRRTRRPAPIPLAPIQPVLGHIVRSIARRHPALFNRLGPYAHRRFLIVLNDLPVALLLHPHPAVPRLRAVRADAKVAHDARIAGRFRALLALIDGRLDSDAIFFSRALSVDGDTEAVVALRNALDDLDEPLAEAVCASFGPLSPPVRLALETLRRLDRESDGDA